MRVRAKLEVHSHVLDELDHAHLSPGKEYIVVGFDDAYFRVLDDAGHPILYSRCLFEITEPEVPSDWVRHEEADGSFYVDPPECAIPGFYEDYFDGRPQTIAVFERVRERLLQGDE